jgi:hypothetical protein
MPELLQRPADDSTAIETGDSLSVRERFWGLDAGQKLVVVDVSEETTAGGEYPERLTLRVAGEETWAGAATVPYHGADVRSAVDAGALELN